MRIVVITQGISPVLSLLLKSKHIIVGIVESAPRKGRSKYRELITSFIQYMYSLRPSNQKNLKDYANKKNIPYFYFNKGMDLELAQWIKIWNPDLIVVSSMSQLLKESIIYIAKNGTINIHHSYLPEYRGPNPVFWMYYDYVLNPGVTVHFIDKGEDTGDIIYQKRFKLSLGDDLQMFYQKSNQIIEEILFKAIDDIEKGTVSVVKQPYKSTKIRARNVSLEEYKQIIPWTEWSVERVYHFMKGTPSYMNSLLKDFNVSKLGSYANVVSYHHCDVAVNQIGELARDGNKCIVKCRNGHININVTYSRRKFISDLVLGR